MLRQILSNTLQELLDSGSHKRSEDLILRTLLPTIRFKPSFSKYFPYKINPRI